MTARLPGYPGKYIILLWMTGGYGTGIPGRFSNAINRVRSSISLHDFVDINKTIENLIFAVFTSGYCFINNLSTYLSTKKSNKCSKIY